jgi:uroporphyrin-III C-methyltransferase / precorrin-2 dehydrogenase / sirohydrochlorin ferrochelatase
LPQDLDWRSLADPSATTIVYMPVKTLAELAASAIAVGLDPNIPAVAVANATRPDERIIAAPISELAAQLHASGLTGPIVVMIGRTFSGIAGQTEYARLKSHLS